MPLKEEEKRTIIRIAKEYGVKRVWLFGSMLDPAPEAEPKDIDLAIEGAPPEKFYELGGKLLWELTKPVDLVDMLESDDYMITSIIRRTGKVIYEKRERNGRKRNNKRHTAGKTACR